MWCCLEPRPEAGVLELGEVADLGALRRRRCPAAGGCTARRSAPSSIVEDSMTLAQTRARAPIVLSTSWLPGPMTLPSPTDVGPRRMTFGSRVTSGARVTSQSR